MNITERIRKLCEINGISINKLEKELNIGRGNIGRWHKHKPNMEDLMKVANRFEVSANYLLFGEEEKKPTLAVEDELDETTKELMKIASEIDDADRQMLLEMARSIRKRRKA